MIKCPYCGKDKPKDEITRYVGGTVGRVCDDCDKIIDKYLNNREEIQDFRLQRAGASIDIDFPEGDVGFHLNNIKGQVEQICLILQYVINNLHNLSEIVKGDE